MTTFNIRPAHRDSAKLLIGLAGPTGSGKTYSALLLATGIVDMTGGKVVGVDTESGRMLQYAPPGDEAFEFDYLELDQPFGPDRYQEAFEAAERHAGPSGVVVIDSMSHEHEGPGGLLEWHDAEVDRLAANSQGGSRERFNFPAWSAPKAARRRLINRILQSRCHVIFCFRAKEKNVLVDKPNGRGKDIVNIGWSPITGDDWPYEMTIFALLNPEKKGVPIIDGFAHGKLPLNMRSLVSTEVAITSDTGRRLAKWAGNGKTAGAAEPAPSAAVKVAKPNGGGIAVWLSEDEPATRFAKGGEAIDALIAAMRVAVDFRELGQQQANNERLIKKAPPEMQREVNDTYRARFKELNEMQQQELPADTGSFADDIDAEGLEPEEWRGEPTQESLV